MRLTKDLYQNRPEHYTKRQWREWLKYFFSKYVTVDGKRMLSKDVTNE